MTRHGLARRDMTGTDEARQDFLINFLLDGMGLGGAGPDSTLRYGTRPE